MQSSRSHKIIYIDGTVTWAAGMAKTFVSAIPSFSCFDLGSFGYDNTQYTQQFATATNPINTKLLYFDATSGVEVHYACMDITRAYAIADYAASLGVPIPKIVMKMAMQIFNFIHVDGVLIFSGSGSNVGSAVTTAIQSALTTSVKYTLTSDATYYSTC